MVFGRRAFFGAFSCPDGETWWFHNGPPTDEALSTEAHRARLLALHEGDPAWIGALIRETPRLLGPWPIHELAGMPRWSKGRVCLVGDAAHLMAPSAGQGASLAFEDALVLSQCLRDLDDPAKAFARFEQLRRARVDAIFREARCTPRTPRGRRACRPCSPLSCRASGPPRSWRSLPRTRLATRSACG